MTLSLVHYYYIDNIVMRREPYLCFQITRHERNLKVYLANTGYKRWQWG